MASMRLWDPGYQLWRHCDSIRLCCHDDQWLRLHCEHRR